MGTKRKMGVAPPRCDEAFKAGAEVDRYHRWAPSVVDDRIRGMKRFGYGPNDAPYGDVTVLCAWANSQNKKQDSCDESKQDGPQVPEQ